MSEYSLHQMVMNFRYHPSVDNFCKLRDAFGYAVWTLQENCNTAKKWDSRCLVGFLFSVIGKYQRKKSAWNYFIIKLLKHCRKLSQCEKLNG